jgi:hypothetical protein
MRQLTEQEVKLTEHSLKRLKEELKELEYSKKYDELQLNEGLDIQFRKAREKFESSLKYTNSEIEEKVKTIKILNEQIEFGVEEKINTDEK